MVLFIVKSNGEWGGKMSVNETSDIPEISRKELGDYIEKIRKENSFGFNQLSIKSGLNARTLNEILNGKSKRTNPYHLQKLGSALRIDYKELYKIVGYLFEEDFEENDKLKLELSSCQNKCKELEKELRNVTKTHNNINHGNQAIGINSQITIENNHKRTSELDFAGIPEDRMEELKRYMEFLKMK